MSFSIIIPSQETNNYHKLGDLAPFGDTTLLEWKISQCKEFAQPSQIYINSNSKNIEKIAKQADVNFIKRKDDFAYQEIVYKSIQEVNADEIVWINTTSPFMSAQQYKKMYEKYKNENIFSLISVEKKKEYIFFNDKKLNFGDEFISRKEIKPIYIMTNGCYIINKKLALELKNIVSTNPSFFEVDSFVATEIKDVFDYDVAREMISMYFKKEINV